MLRFYKARVFQALTGNPDSDRRRRRRRRRRREPPVRTFRVRKRTLAPLHAAVYSTLFSPHPAAKSAIWALLKRLYGRRGGEGKACN